MDAGRRDAVRLSSVGEGPVRWRRARQRDQVERERQAATSGRVRVSRGRCRGEDEQSLWWSLGCSPILTRKGGRGSLRTHAAEGPLRSHRHTTSSPPTRGEAPLSPEGPSKSLHKQDEAHHIEAVAALWNAPLASSSREASSSGSRAFDSSSSACAEGQTQRGSAREMWKDSSASMDKTSPDEPPGRRSSTGVLAPTRAQAVWLRK